MSTTNLHPGIPRKVRVSGCPNTDLNTTYDLCLNSKSQVYIRTSSFLASLFGSSGKRLSNSGGDDKTSTRKRSAHVPQITFCKERSRWKLVTGAEEYVAERAYEYGPPSPDGVCLGGTMLVEAVSNSGSLIGALAFPAPRMNFQFYQTGGASKTDITAGFVHPSLLGHENLLFLQAGNDKVPALHVTYPNATTTVLYSHGNGEDLGLIVDYIEQLSQTCECNVLAYDYPGYSLNQLEGGTPSENGCYAAINSAFSYLVDELKVSRDSIVLYGRSIGSGPTCDLAHRERCGGVVLQSPIASGARVLANNVGVLVYPFDIFTNYTKVPRIACQVAVMHGSADEVVPCLHGQELHTKLRLPYRPLWIDGRGHNDMPNDVCFDYTAEFLRHLEGKRGASASVTKETQQKGALGR